MADPVLSFTVSTPSPYTSATITDTSSYVSPSRSGYGVFLAAFKVDYQGNVTLLGGDGPNGSPATATIWGFNLDGDGWYQFIFIAGPNYAGGTTYARYSIVHDPSSSLLYQSQQNTNIGNALSDPNWWRAITSGALFGANQLYAIYVASLTNPVLVGTPFAYNRVLKPVTQSAFGDQASLKALEGVTDAYRRIDVQNYELLRIFVDAMQEDETAQLYNEGEKVARRAEILIATL